MSKRSKHVQFTRGGQIFFHNIRMWTQVFKKIVSIVFIFFAVFLIGWYFLGIAHYERYLTNQWLMAHWYNVLNHESRVSLMLPGGTIQYVYPDQIINAPSIKAVVQRVVQSMWHVLFFDVVLSCFVFFLVGYGFRRYGKERTEKKHIRGDRFEEAKVVKNLIKQAGRASDFVMGSEKVPFIKYSLQQHIMYHGTTGSGKSNALRELLDQIHKKQEKQFIYDKGGTFIKHYYREGHDIILNPLDKRTYFWNIWAECENKADFDTLSCALIPMPPSTQDPFWVKAARTIFSAAAYRMQCEDSKPNVLKLLRYLLTSDIDELSNLLSGTEAETLMSKKTEKTAISIKTILATYLKCLCFLPSKGTPISIRDWVQDDSQRGTLFISSVANKHESLKPLITAWIDIAVNTLMSLKTDTDRRLWFFLDELPTLHQLPYLRDALSEARKFGGCFVIGLQSYAQLEDVYGTKAAQSISSLLNTRMFFRQVDPGMASWSSKNLGRALIEEIREGVSYGANTIRDGVTLNRSERDTVLVYPGEVMNLPDLSAYLRLPGDCPITKIKYAYKTRPTIADEFIERIFKMDNLQRDVIKLADKLSQVTTQNNKTDSQNENTKSKKKDKEKGDESITFM